MSLLFKLTYTQGTSGGIMSGKREQSLNMHNSYQAIPPALELPPSAPLLPKLPLSLAHTHTGLAI